MPGNPNRCSHHLCRWEWRQTHTHGLGVKTKPQTEPGLTDVYALFQRKWVASAGDQFRETCGSQ